jgi:glyoxylase-like metal-dependent hydrolase (beta-lactamase superfamily II)
MIEQIRENLYRIEIPLPQNPLKALNSYFIRGTDRNILIDTGFNRDECRAAMDQAIKTLDISLENTDLFITHIHSDHSGLAGYLTRPGNKIYTGLYTKQGLCGSSNMANYFEDLIKQSGLIEMGVTTDIMIHPGYRYRSVPVSNLIAVQDDTVIRVGDFALQCINTTGHAPDHICLYDAKHKILFSGDHILGGITPNNTIWGVPWTIQVDYLGEYFKSLDIIDALDVELTLPGHRGILSDCHGRIKELKIHHDNRLDSILDILGTRSMTGAEVASEMEWDIDIKSWQQFPWAQKLFAAGEALSHLTHLVFKGIVDKCLKNGIVYYQKTL